MKIELRKISYNARLSQETNAFAADVYIDGVKAGTAENAGHGGSTNVFLGAKQKEAEAFCAAMPPVDCHGTKLEMDLELYIGELLEKHLVEKEQKRWIKTKLCFRLTGDKVGEYRTIKLTGGQYTKALKAHITTKYGDTLIENLNEAMGQIAV